MDSNYIVHSSYKWTSAGVYIFILLSAPVLYVAAVITSSAYDLEDELLCFLEVGDSAGVPLTWLPSARMVA